MVEQVVYSDKLKLIGGVPVRVVDGEWGVHIAIDSTEAHKVAAQLRSESVPNPEVIFHHVSEAIMAHLREAVQADMGNDYDVSLGKDSHDVSTITVRVPHINSVYSDLGTPELAAKEQARQALENAQGGRIDAILDKVASTHVDALAKEAQSSAEAVRTNLRSVLQAEGLGDAETLITKILTVTNGQAAVGQSAEQRG